MLTIPKFLKPHFAQAKKLKGSHCVQEVEFSGPTYQVKVLDPSTGDEMWTFLKLDKSGAIQDAFCSCQESEEGQGCWHLALAYLSLFDTDEHPLHEKFEASIWNALGWIWFRRYGKKKPALPGLSLKGWGAKALDSHGKLFFEELLREKPGETEENSLKFSNLSESELDAWRRGEPKEELQYELSFWGDLAKKLMLRNKKKAYDVLFPFKGSQLPKEVEILSPDLLITSSLKQEDWPALIPTLGDIKSNLHLYSKMKDLIEKIAYDSDAGTLLLQHKTRPDLFKNAVSVGDWLFASGKGFYPKEGTALLAQEIGPDKIAAFLNRNAGELTGLIKGISLHKGSFEPHYQLSFDNAWNLHLDPYLEKTGDLQSPGAHNFGEWIFLPGKGFYHLEMPLFQELPQMISEGDVPAFIRTHAAWLSQQKGFDIHLGSLETQVRYQVDNSGNLHFDRRLPLEENKHRMKEFGPWVYVEGEGFFNKVHTHVSLPIPFGQVLRSDQVAHFIQRNRQELELVPGFFFEDIPFQEVGLHVHRLPDDKIRVDPHYTLKTKYQGMRLRYYDEWIYIQGRGFCELPSEMRLPEKVREGLSVNPSEYRDFFEKTLPSLQNFVQSIDAELVKPLSFRIVLTEIKPETHFLWRLKLHYQTEHGPVSLLDIDAVMKKRKHYLFSPVGRIDLNQEHLQWLKRLRTGALQEDGSLLLSAAELIRLHAFEEIQARGESHELLKEILELKQTPPFDCSRLKSALRPYQEKGARWLFALAHYGLGGLLCDEMGLGKTHQAMALISAMQNLNKELRVLVVCPTSVLYHWEEKLAAYYPSLKVLTFHGPFRKKDLTRDFDLLLTSYGILRNEGPWINEQHFDVAFFDEIQVAKNHRSKLYAALQKVKTDIKVGLTGTPVENRLRELKTLFDLVLPGYMPSDADYQRLIVRPIEKERDMQQKGLLQRLTRPFVLRRRKVDVLCDLPEKTEEIAHCDLHPVQERLYNDVLLNQRDELLKDIIDTSKPVPFLHVFSLLSRLKQVCDHPALYLKKTEEYKKYHSGKWDLFIELLQEARESEQKVVVYSQYLGMLDIIETYLKEQGIGFASIRGSTRDRKEQIRLFAQEPSCEVFVASLKAAGLGIDLTAGSVVIHYDRWWNAARENQATDRVHRIGQSRGVQVFKLVTKNTFEERIHQIIERKKELMEEAIGVDDHEILKAFTREEIFELLKLKET